MQTLKSEEMSQLQLGKREAIDEEEVLFEAIDTLTHGRKSSYKLEVKKSIPEILMMGIRKFSEEIIGLSDTSLVVEAIKEYTQTMELGYDEELLKERYDKLDDDEKEASVNLGEDPLVGEIKYNKIKVVNDLMHKAKDHKNVALAFKVSEEDLQLKALQYYGIKKRLGNILKKESKRRRKSSVKDVKKLQDAGTEAKVDKICEAAEKLVNYGYITGSDALLKRKVVVKITTGSQALDKLLGGGIETQQITEAFGEFRSGKIELAHTLCVSAQLPTSMEGGNGKVAYIDTEGTFRPDRIVPIAERFGMDPGAVLDNIICARAYKYNNQYDMLLDLAAKMAEEPFRLLIVDFTGRGERAEREQKLTQMLTKLTEIAEEFNVAVYMTIQGGHVLAYATTVRLMFRKGNGEQRVCKVFDAPNHAESEAIFQITDGGIADAKD